MAGSRQAPLSDTGVSTVARQHQALHNVVEQLVQVLGAYQATTTQLRQTLREERSLRDEAEKKLSVTTALPTELTLGPAAKLLPPTILAR